MSNDAARYAFQRYVRMGLSPIAAAGIVGNLNTESGFAPDVISGERRGDNGSAAYLAQWRGPRLANFERYASSRGGPTLDNQLDFVVHEGRNNLDAGAAKALQLVQGARTPQEAAQVWMANYERPNPDPNINHIGQRQSTAAGLAGAYDPSAPVNSFQNGSGSPPAAFGDVVAPPPVAPAASPPGIGDAIATFMASRQDRDKAAAAEKARRQALFGGLTDLYG